VTEPSAKTHTGTTANSFQIRSGVSAAGLERRADSARTPRGLRSNHGTRAVNHGTSRKKGNEPSPAITTGANPYHPIPRSPGTQPSSRVATIIAILTTNGAKANVIPNQGAVCRSYRRMRCASSEPFATERNQSLPSAAKKI
jgi:hypothetical protein